jgi:hypothetical protein
MKYINAYFFNFLNYISKGYDKLLHSLFYNLNNSNHLINIYNIYLFNALNDFFVLFNIEEIKLEHEKTHTVKEK